MKVYLDEHDSFPVYDVVDEAWEGAIPVNVSKETHDRWVRITTEFEKIQDEMSKQVTDSRMKAKLGEAGGAGETSKATGGDAMIPCKNCKHWGTLINQEPVNDIEERTGYRKCKRVAVLECEGDEENKIEQGYPLIIEWERCEVANHDSLTVFLTPPDFGCSLGEEKD